VSKITFWLIRNSILGSLISIIFGDDWIETKPKLVTAVKLFFYFIYLMALLGFVLALLEVGY